MKKILIVLLALTLGVSTSFAQEKKQKKSETVTFQTDLDCENCAKKILNVIPFKKGVKDCVVDVATKTVEVTFDPRKTNAETLTAELKKIDVNVVAPTECKGGCQKGECCGEKKGECKEACCDKKAECKGDCKEHQAKAGACVSEHIKQDACCGGGHNHAH